MNDGNKKGERMKMNLIWLYYFHLLVKINVVLT